MTAGRRKLWRWLAAAAALLLLVGVGAPYLNVSRYARRIQSGLEHALGRQVEFGEVRLNLFTGPGFSVSKVIVHEDPAIGLEPLIYADSMEARVSLKSLWTGRLEFSSLYLREPSINLVKPSAGTWNFATLLRRAVGAAPVQGAAFPEVRVSGGRVNFKFGDTKTVFYLTDPEIAVQPPAATGGDWRFRFSGEPARTDRTAHGFGKFSGQGRWIPEAGGPGRLELDLELERGRIDELVALIHGHDIGVHGLVSSRIHMAGPVSALQAGGSLQISDIHRWDLMPAHGQGWRLDFRGRLDLLAQDLQLESASPGEEHKPFAVQVRVADFLANPRWSVRIALDRLPVDALPEVARHMGVALPEQLALEGNASGTVGYSSVSGLEGRLTLADASIKLPDSPPVLVEGGEFELEAGQLRIAPAVFRPSPKEQLTLEGVYGWQEPSLRLSLEAESLRVDGLRTGLGKLLSLGSVPLLGNLSGGSWSGHLRIEQRGEAAGLWTGQIDVRDVRAAIPGLSDALEVSRARVLPRADGVVMERIQGRAGAVDLQGEYRYRNNAARPHQFRISAEKADAAELERLLLPTLRRGGSFLARALRLGRAPAPDWLEGRRAEGAFEIGALAVGPASLESVHGRVRWDGASAEITELAARLGESKLNGRIAVDLRRALPSYKITSQLRPLLWQEAEWDVTSSLQTSGVGTDLVGNARATGAFRCAAVELLPGAPWKSVAGSFDLRWARGLPSLRLTNLAVTQGQDTFRGQGATREDGKLLVELSDGEKQVRLEAALAPFRIEPVR